MLPCGVCPNRYVSGYLLLFLHHRVPQPNELFSCFLSCIYCLIAFSFEFPSANQNSVPIFCWYVYYFNSGVPNCFTYIPCWGVRTHSEKMDILCMTLYCYYFDLNSCIFLWVKYGKFFKRILSGIAKVHQAFAPNGFKLIALFQGTCTPMKYVLSKAGFIFGAFSILKEESRRNQTFWWQPHISLNSCVFPYLTPL